MPAAAVKLVRKTKSERFDKYINEFEGEIWRKNLKRMFRKRVQGLDTLLKEQVGVVKQTKTMRDGGAWIVQGILFRNRHPTIISTFIITPYIIVSKCNFENPL